MPRSALVVLALSGVTAAVLAVSEWGPPASGPPTGRQLEPAAGGVIRAPAAGATGRERTSAVPGRERQMAVPGRERPMAVAGGEPATASVGASTTHRRAPALDAPTALPGLPRWQWPLYPRPAVVQEFRAPLSRYGRGHRGLDLAASVGGAVLAVEDGRVVHAGPVAGRGTVSVQHHDGLRSTYEPVEAVVAVGDVVSVGEVLGMLDVATGRSHCGASPCLHLGARRLGTYRDPLPLLTGGRLALLPLR